jgi:hypothetical protein
LPDFPDFPSTFLESGAAAKMKKPRRLRRSGGAHRPKGFWASQARMSHIS